MARNPNPSCAVKTLLQWGKKKTAATSVYGDILFNLGKTQQGVLWSTNKLDQLPASRQRTWYGNLVMTREM